MIDQKGVHVLQFYLPAPSFSPALSVLYSFSFSWSVTQLETHKRTVTVLWSGKWRPYGCHELFHCPPPTAFVGWPWEPDKQWEWLEGWGLYGGGQETENRKPCPQGEKKRSEHAETERRLWLSCRNCGMKTWKLAMQLKVRANWKFGCCNWKAFNNYSQKHTCTNTHSHTMTSLPTQLVIAFRYGHLPTNTVSSGCDQYASLCDCS